MRPLARLLAPRSRGSAHALRSVLTRFTLVEPFPNGKLYFKRAVDRPVCVYVLGGTLVVLASAMQAFSMIPLGGRHFHLTRGGRFFSPGDYLDDETCLPTSDWSEARAWEAFRLADPPALDARERAAIAAVDRLAGRPDAPDGGDAVEVAVRGCLAGLGEPVQGGARAVPPAPDLGGATIGRGFNGSVDLSRRTRAAGWAARGKEATTVSVFVNGARVGEAHGTGERPDVIAAGFARHSAWSFVFEPPLGPEDRAAFRFPDGSPVRIADGAYVEMQESTPAVRHIAPADDHALGSVYTLVSAFNQLVLCDRSDVGLRFEREPEKPACVYVVENMLFFLRSELQAFIIVTAPNGACNLKSTHNGRFFSLGRREADGCFFPAANRTFADAWETFELSAQPQLSQHEREIIELIDMVVERRDDPGLPALLGDRLDVDIIGACLVAGTPNNHAPGLDALLVHRPFATALSQTFPSDSYAKAFQRLLEATPATETEIAIGDLWRNGLDGDTTSLSFSINCLARQLHEPTRKICVLATLRNEAPYIVEWLAHHRSIGIERFFIYENDSQDGSRELVDCLAGHGLIDVVHNVVAEDGNAQSSAYAHALSLRPELLDYEWCLVIDLDEFLLLNCPSFATIDDFLETFAGRDADAIAVNWIAYGPNGRLRRDPGRPVMETFTWRQPQPDRHVKSIIRPRKFFASQAHFPYRYRAQPFAFVDTLGAAHAALDGQTAWSARPDESRVGLAHYVYKSLDEFLLKWSRNRGDNPRRLTATNEHLTKDALEAFVTVFHEHGGPALPSAQSAKAAAEMRRIRALPGIAAIEQEIEEHYARTIGGVREMFLSGPAIRSSNMGARFRGLIELAATLPEMPDHAGQSI